LKLRKPNLAKPEARYVGRVHGHLANNIHHQGMGLTATNGTPDDWYEGSKDTIWIEYKWWEKIPAIFNLCTRKSTPKLSKLQQRWLKRGYKNASNVAVVIGSPDGSIFLPNLEWSGEVKRDDYIALSEAQIAQIIESIVHELPCITQYKRSVSNCWETFSPQQDAVSELGDT
jgi:hypothetical protein